MNTNTPPLALGRRYTVPPQIATHENKDQDCPGTSFLTVEVGPVEGSAVAACELCGFLVGVTDDGVAPRFDELLSDSTARPFVVHLRFLNGATELRNVYYAFANLKSVEDFSRIIGKQSRSELSRNGGTSFDLSITKDGSQIGETKVFVI